MPVIEQMLYEWYIFMVQTGEWGPYEALTPTKKIAVWLRWLRGIAVWVSNGLIVWSILTLVVVVCRLTILFFQPQRHICPHSTIGGYCRL